MKSTRYIVALVITFILEAVLCFYFLGKMDIGDNDPVKINECLKSVETNYGDESSYITSVDYSVLDADGNVVFTTRSGLSESVNDAVKNSDPVLDIELDGKPGKMIVHNDTQEKMASCKKDISVTIISLTAVQLIVVLSYFVYLRNNISVPFIRMNEFASRVAEGDLDVPLYMDKKHVFGSFTEAFDIMRTELKKARNAEKKANDDKKEMVAKLSHDIKTPIASIKSTSEIGYELASDEKIKDYFNLINVKSDQITLLVDNLFNSSVNDVTEIHVEPSNYDSSILNDMIRNADHLRKAGEFNIPSCTVYADKVRLQQSLDNIFMNSYKYADTPIIVDAVIDKEYLKITISDEGPGVTEEELPLLKNKYERGSNAADKDGAGLGLYLTNYFMEHMEGKLILDNKDKGFAASLWLRTI